MSYKFKSYEYHDQTVQVLKHEGFASGVIGMRHEQTPKTEGERTLLLARPAAWTEDTLKCHDPKKWEAFYEDGDVRSMKPKRKAVRLCQGCPAAPRALGGQYDELGLCLREALQMEGGVGAQHRYGVRGGLTSTGRADLDDREVPEVGIAELLYAATHCTRGHTVLGEHETYADGACRRCRAEDFQAKQRERREGAA